MRKRIGRDVMHALLKKMRHGSRLRWLVVFLCLSFAATPGYASAAPEPALQLGGIKIVSPQQGGQIAAAPVDVKVNFNGFVRGDSFRAWLNGRDVTKRFTVSTDQAVASLDETDGINYSPDGRTGRLNILLVQAAGANFWSFLHDTSVFFVKAKSLQAAGVITPQGGTLTMPGVGQVTFPAGSFTTNTSVQVQVTRDATVNKTFDDTAGPMFDASARLPYELRVRTSKTQPLVDPIVTFTMPESFRSALPAGTEARVFAENLGGGSDELLDTFEVLPNRFFASDTSAVVTMPRLFFTDGLRTDGVFELTTTMAATPTAAPTTRLAVQNAVSAPTHTTTTEPSSTSVAATPKETVTTLQATDSCEGTTLDQPLDGNLEVTSPFGTRTHPILKTLTGHFGTDLRAADGTTVRAMADGVIEKVNTNAKTAANGKTIGWGQYIVLRHSDGSKSLYGHLQSGTPLAVGTQVTEGQSIALSDTTGGATGPHLHVEYAPNGQIFDKASKVDPMPCIGGNATGSITVRDNGNLADDAFSVAINGKVVCTTAIGASNTCAVGKLRPGTKTLMLTAVIAPDDIGTFEITLSNGLAFSDGSTSVSGVIAQGASASYSIIVPAPTP